MQKIFIIKLYFVIIINILFVFVFVFVFVLFNKNLLNSFLLKMSDRIIRFLRRNIYWLIVDEKERSPSWLAREFILAFLIYAIFFSMSYLICNKFMSSEMDVVLEYTLWLIVLTVSFGNTGHIFIFTLLLALGLLYFFNFFIILIGLFCFYFGSMLFLKLLDLHVKCARGELN